MTTDSLKIDHLSLPTLRPIACYSLHGIAFKDQQLWAVDSIAGYLLQIDPKTQNTTIMNPENWSDFIGSTGIAISGDTLWFTSDDSVYFCELNDLTKSQLFVRLSEPINGIAVNETTVYLTCYRRGKILVYSRENGKKITTFSAPGIGVENITCRGEELWISDTLEQSVYCLDRATGEIIFNILTPFPEPTGLTFYYEENTGKETLYVAYSTQEPYIRDNPNAEPNYELQYRDSTFIHPLYFQYFPQEKYALSNGYLVEMSYVEEISPLDPVILENLEWRIALPAETSRQKLRKIEPVGIPFTEEIQDGQRIAVFKFDKLTGNSRHIFGWKAILEVWGIKYQLTPKDCENLTDFPSDISSRYLHDDDDLAMHTPIIERAARESIGRETNYLRQVYSIRNYVYDRLSYGIKPHIDTPDLVLKRGVGSCGEYLGVLLALSRLNGIPCRTVGRYKCPPHPLDRNKPLQPDFNHVWMEFYLPGLGWLPMESNPDDIIDGGPYPTRFFMGLAWYHAEMAKGIPFETLRIDGEPVTKEQTSIGELAINHVRFVILDELNPSINQ